MRIYDPLTHDHPLVVDMSTCHICKKQFFTGERVTLVPMEGYDDHKTAPCHPAHARCYYVGKTITITHVIQHVRDGNGSPFPIVTDKGQFTTHELELA